MKVSILDKFRDFSEYRKWIAKAYGNLSSLNSDETYRFTPKGVEAAKKYLPDWYGPGAKFEDLEAGINQYANPGLLGGLLEKVKSSLSAETLKSVAAKRMRFNAMGLGMFSFDRAAMGLYRVKELFSPAHGRRVEELETEERDGRRFLLADGTPVEERWERRADGKPRARTNTKRLFAYFPEEKRLRRVVSIVVDAGGHAQIKAKDFLYSGLSAVVIAQLLEQAGICTTIDVFFGSVVADSATGKSKEVCGCLVPVKGVEQALDANLVAMATSDPRFFRYEGFKGILAAYDHFGKRVPEAFGYTPSIDEIEDIVAERDYAAGRDSEVVCVSKCFSEQAALQAIEQAIRTITIMSVR